LLETTRSVPVVFVLVADPVAKLLRRAEDGTEPGIRSPKY
jgi:hypothetical protein